MLHALAHAGFWIAVFFAIASGLMAVVFVILMIDERLLRQCSGLCPFVNWGFTLAFALASLFWALVSYTYTGKPWVP